MSFDIAELIEKSGGEVIGKVRFQKMIYLLDQLGFESGFPFEYHHYGPYSEELSDAVQEEIIFGHVEAATKYRRSDGAPYVVFRPLDVGHGTSVTEKIKEEKLLSSLKKFNDVSSTVLELAATIHWLAFVEKVENWKEELVSRKGAKTEGGKDNEALQLLKDLGLSPN